MDNPEILFYIVAALIYFLSKGRKKKRKVAPRQEKNAPPGVEKDESADSPGPVMTFEDLLKEFTGQGSSKPKSVEPIEPIEPIEPKKEVSKPIEVDRGPKNVEQEPAWKKVLLRPSIDDEEIDRRFQDAVYKPPESTINVEKEKKSRYSGRSEAYKIKKEKAAFDIREMLDDPDNLKKAVILKEVLERRY